MKNMCLIIALFYSNIAVGQNENITVKIFSIKKYQDGFLFKGIDTLKNDTINIISVNGIIKDKCSYQKINPSEIYRFVITRITPGQYMLEKFSVRIKNTIVWKSGDSPKDIPVYANNTIGNFIKREN